MINIYAGVAELVDAWDLKSHGGDLVRVQFPSPVPLYKICGATKLHTLQRAQVGSEKIVEAVVKWSETNSHNGLVIFHIK